MEFVEQSDLAAAPLGTADILRGYLSGFPDFAAYLSLSLAFATIFVVTYSRLTPHHEFKLIRDGNTAAVPALLGALLGFALPMRAAMGGAASIVDFGLWSLIAAVVQICAFFLARFAMPELSERITRDELAAGIWLGGVSVLVGVLNASAMTY
jgi:putative membrane protein